MNERPDAPEAKRLLRALDELHVEMLADLARLQQLCEDQRPDARRLAELRWRLGRCSRDRWSLISTHIEPFLKTKVSVEDWARITALQEDARADRARSADHVARWLLIHVLDDWSGYRRDHIVIRQMMQDRISRERDIFAPLLSSIAW